MGDGAEIAREIADVTVGANDLCEIVTLKAISNGKWNLESIITQEYPLERIAEAIQTAADPDKAFNVTIRF